MWLVVLALTIILWFILDNVLIAAMLAIFALFLFTTTRALWLTRKQPKEQTLEVQNAGGVSGTSELSGADVVSSSIEASGAAPANVGVVLSSDAISNSAPELFNNSASELLNNTSVQEELEIDDSYLALVEEDFREAGESLKHEWLDIKKAEHKISAF